MRIFIDTEFTDFVNPELISVGMVAESGQEFYAEVPFNDALCSAFVREVVIPLLSIKTEHYCSVSLLGQRMIDWLASVRQGDDEILICVGFQTDWDLFVHAAKGNVPEWCRPRYIGRQINELMRYDFHQRNKLPEHHALNDARANHYACRERNSVTQTNNPKLKLSLRSWDL